jgi:hypothetical protein
MFTAMVVRARRYHILLIIMLLALLFACGHTDSVRVAPPVSSITPVVTTPNTAMIAASSTLALHPLLPLATATSQVTHLLGFTLGPVALHMSLRDVRRTWGKPRNETITHGIGTPEWSYPNGAVIGATSDATEQASTVWRIVVHPPYDGRTHEGIQVGDTEAAVRQAYHKFPIQTSEHPHQIQIVDTHQTSLGVLFDLDGKAALIILETCLECGTQQTSINTPAPAGQGKQP